MGWEATISDGPEWKPKTELSASTKGATVCHGGGSVRAKCKQWIIVFIKLQTKYNKKGPLNIDQNMQTGRRT